MFPLSFDDYASIFNKDVAYELEIVIPFEEVTTEQWKAIPNQYTILRIQSRSAVSTKWQKISIVTHDHSNSH